MSAAIVGRARRAADQHLVHGWRGIKGRNLLVMIEEIEAATGQPGRLFDLVGTSIGGCSALFVFVPGRGEACRLARKCLRELQTRCFAGQSGVRLLQQGYLCDDQRRLS